MWYTQWKDSRPIESGPIECEEFRKAFLGKEFPHDKREVKELMNLRQGNMSVEEYSLKFNLLSKYTLYLVSNPRMR